MDLQARLDNRELKYKFTIHAEVNAILTAGHQAKGGKIYVSCPLVCHECAKVLVQAGTKEVIFLEQESDVFKRWKESNDITKILFNEANIEYRGVKLWD